MISVAIGMVATYLGRKAAKLVGRAADDVDAEIDSLLDRLYTFVGDKLKSLGRRGERSLLHLESQPDDERNQRDLEEDLEDALVDDPDGRATLASLLAAIRTIDPDGARLSGYAKSYRVAPGARNVGAELIGQAGPGTSVEGTAETVWNEGDNIGARIDRR